MQLTSPITAISGVGDSFAKRLQALNILTVLDLLNHFPSRYLDYSKTTDISDIETGEDVCILATVDTISSIRLRSNRSIQNCTISDTTGSIKITWFNQPYLKDALKTGTQYYFTGIAQQFKGKMILNAPDFEPLRDKQIHTKRIIPIYHLTQGISHKWLRHKINLCLDLVKVPEVLPTNISKNISVVDQNTAYHDIHFPASNEDLSAAQYRLAFNDLLSIYLKSAITKKDWASHSAIKTTINESLYNEFINTLDYKLTDDQSTAIGEIFTDLKASKPMNRLLQGDVGSGKTIVAMAATLQMHHNEKTTLILAPTQVLAQQHYLSFSKLLEPFSITPTLITGQAKKTAHYSSVIIGTHALLHRSELLEEREIGLIVVDEQHRFGVLQRSHFLNKKQIPHTLTMSATPIPRTIALAFYGHLDISNIKTMPNNRKIIKTWVVTEKKRLSAYSWIEKQITSTKTQAFFICPLIDDSENENMKNIKAATSEFNNLKKVFPKLKIALLHGKMKPQEKNDILTDFKSKKFHILVSTPVIEVGIDIPNASIIVIEAAQRFGLAQLHQLRGRVGRGASQSYCLLFGTEDNKRSLQRLKLLEKHHQGLSLARLDLKIRGAGEMFGTSQSGHLDTNFNQFWNAKLNSLAQMIANDLVDNNSTQAESIITSLNPSLAKTASPN